jgi:hypothetical protein
MTTLRTIEGADIMAQPATTTETTKNLLDAATSNNVTNTVARTLLVKLSEAKSQGLGSDIPTQEKLIAQAVAQIKQDRGTPVYAKDALPVSANTPDALKAYGNTVIATIATHPKANYLNVLRTVGEATDKADAKRLDELTGIGADYEALAKDLSAVPVPPKLLSFHLQIVNNLNVIGESMTDIQVLYKDPLKGFAGFDLFESLSNETNRVFTNIAQQFNQDGILFNKGEPGSDWASLVSS